MELELIANMFDGVYEVRKGTSVINHKPIYRVFMIEGGKSEMMSTYSSFENALLFCSKHAKLRGMELWERLMN